MKQLFLVLSALLLSAQTAMADNLAFANRWYEALRTTSRPTFLQLLADEAKIELKSLGVVQDKNEFIESLDYWEDVAGDLLISTTIVSSTDTKLEVDVCYQFPSNSHTNREMFFLKDEKIIRQVQEKLREGC